jgi:hypothetical protein
MTNINDLVQFAASNAVKKPSKDKGFNLLLALLAGEDLSRTERAGLIKLFIPPAPTKNKTALDWVKKHTAKQDVRYYLKYVYVSGADIVATNGHFLALTPNIFGLADGFYNPKTGLAENVDARFPDYSRVIPKTNDTWHDLSHCASKIYATKIPKFAKFIRLFDLPDGTPLALNSEYYDSILNHPSGIKAIWGKDGTAAIKIEFFDGSVGVIMPTKTSMADLVTD